MSVLSNILAALLGFGFIFVGLVKLTPAIYAPAYEETGQKFSELFTPFLIKDVAAKTGIVLNITFEEYRRAVGVAEAVVGVLVLYSPLRQAAALTAVFIMIGAIYTELNVGGSVVPASVFGILALTVLSLSGPKIRKSPKKST